MSQQSCLLSKGPIHRAAALLSITILALAVGLWPRLARSVGPTPSTPLPTPTHGPYSTKFLRAESPISEGGAWVSGKAAGLDWADVWTTPGFAFGMEIGGHRNPPQQFDDATALLAGTWGPNQTVQATVHSVNQNQDNTMWEEVEIRLRSTISLHICTGYEIMFRCAKTPHSYCNIARWEGPLGKFTYIKNMGGAKYGVKDGDVVKASIIGNLLTVYINGEEIGRVTDNRFSSGNPGMGFFLDGTTGKNRDYGFTNFTATDR